MTRAAGHVTRGVGLLAAGLVVLAWYPGNAGARQYQTHVRAAPHSSSGQGVKKTPEQRLKTIKNNPYAKAMTLRQLAGQAAGKGQMGKARKALQKALELNALSSVAQQQMRSNLAQLYAASDDPHKVISVLAPLVKKGVSAKAIDGKAWLALGMAYAKLGQWDKAVEPMQRAAADKSLSGDVLYQLQLAVYMHAGRYADAVNVLQHLLKRKPGDGQLLLELAAVQSKRHKYDAAVAALVVAQRSGVLKTADQRLQLIGAYLSSGAPYSAATQLSAWMRDDQVPANASNWRLLALAWIQAKETKRAIKPLQHAARASGHARLYAQLGQLQMDLAHWGDAVKAFKQALAHGGGGQTGQVLMSQGLAYYQMDRPDAARHAFARAEKDSAVARLARQWVRFLDTKPPSLQPLQLQGLGGSGVSGESLAPLTTLSPEQRKKKILQHTPADVPKTKDRYTPVGAVRAGNADGAIPPWTGGLTRKRAPASNQSGGPVVDPFSAEKPLFTITRDNLDHYKKLLNPGEKAMFKLYADYSMPVYTSHRSAAYPPAIYKATLANQSTAHLKDPDALKGAHLGFPFRKPDNGVEVMWNHRLRYRGRDLRSRTDAGVVGDGGIMQMQRRIEDVLFGYGNPHPPKGMPDNILAYVLMTLQPRAGRGVSVLVHETMDNRKTPRRVWIAVPQLHRVMRLPPVGYDTPLPGTHAMLYADQLDMYNGLFNHYVWKLVGRREMIVPYNAYRLQSQKLTYKKLLQPHFPARGPMRYERHRVWIVEATTRPGDKNKFSKRVFYLDEDSWSILMVDCYDNRGKLWRFQEGHPVEYYGQQVLYTAPVFIFDFKTGRYYATQLSNQAPGVTFNTGDLKRRNFMPAALQRKLD